MGLAVTPRLRFLQKYQKQQSLKRDTARDAANRDTNPQHTSLLPAGSEEEETGSEDEAALPQPPRMQQEAFGFEVEDDLDDILKVKAKTTVSSSDDDMEEDHGGMAEVIVLFFIETLQDVSPLVVLHLHMCRRVSWSIRKQFLF